MGRDDEQNEAQGPECVKEVHGGLKKRNACLLLLNFVSVLDVKGDVVKGNVEVFLVTQKPNGSVFLCDRVLIVGPNDAKGLRQIESSGREGEVVRNVAVLPDAYGEEGDCGYCGYCGYCD